MVGCVCAFASTTQSITRCSAHSHARSLLLSFTVQAEQRGLRPILVLKGECVTCSERLLCKHSVKHTHARTHTHLTHTHAHAHEKMPPQSNNLIAAHAPAPPVRRPSLSVRRKTWCSSVLLPTRWQRQWLPSGRRSCWAQNNGVQ